MSQYSRAIWTIQGSINHINKISVQLKCKVCNSKATELLMSYQCMKCSSKVNLRPVWQCNVSFNDGTGECNVYAEGDTVFNLLGQTNKKSSEHFRKMISVIETGVQLHGKIIYNSYFSSFQSGKINSVDDCEHIDYDNFDFLSKPKEEEVLLVNFVKNFVSAPVIELRVKIMVDKPYKPKDKQPSSKLHSAHQTVEVIENLNSTSNRYNNVVESSSSSNIFYSKETNNFLKVDEDYLKNDIIKNVNGIRNVKVQEDNTSRPYSVSYMNIPTLSMKRLTVEAMTAKVLKSSDLILEAWKQLDTIMKYEFD